MLLVVYAHNISCWDCMSLSGLENFLNRDNLSQIVIYHGSRGGWIEVARRSEVKIRQVTLRLIRLLHGCVDNVRRTRLMCEVISCDKRVKADLTFPTFFFEQEYRLLLLLLFFFFGERRMNVASSWTPPTKGRLFELRQDHDTGANVWTNYGIKAKTARTHISIDYFVLSVCFVDLFGEKLSKIGSSWNYIALF